MKVTAIGRHNRSTKRTQADGRADGDQLTEVLRDELAFLRRELETRRESERELRIIIARLTEQLKTLPAGASDAPERDESPRDEPQDTGYVYHVPEPVRRPWWQWWRRDREQ